jgi:hypothetical protein
MRVIVQETADPNSIQACGTYANGETQDYKISFAAPANDLSVYELVAPTNGACRNTAQLVTVRIRNTGNVAKSNVPLSLVIKNGGSTVATLTGTYPSNIDPSDVVTYTFQDPFSAVAGNTYTFEIISSEATDQNRKNDTLRTDVSIAATPAAPDGAAEVCGSIGVLKVNNPNAGGNYFWYSSPTASNAIATGSNTSTTVIPSNNTYYVGTGARGTVGIATKAAFPNGGGYMTSNAANFMKYSASVPVLLESAKLYIKYPGKIEFIVADILTQTSTGYTYSAISTTTVDVYATSPTPAPGTQNGYDAADQGADFNLNLFLPAGDHAIIIRPVGSTNIFRSNNVTGSPYPFTVDNLISFTGNSATQTGDPNYFQSFYYYLYNMKVRTSDCISERATVVAPVIPTPSITQVGDSLVSSLDNGNQWQINGVNIAGATTRSIKPVQSGTYTVVQSGTLGCQRASSGFVFIMTAVDPVTTTPLFEMSLVPNPNRGQFVLKFKTDRKEDLKIDIVNVQGQVVHSRSHPKFVGSLTENFNLTHLSSGIYVVKLQQGNKVHFGKIVIDK